MGGGATTPMMRQYLALKREIPAGAILMFRLGDFYEMFADDAIVASPVLGATLTKRNGVPMCGVPHHALDSYLAKLVRAGMTAALCDQVEDPKTAKGLVRREITRIVTPGTVTEDGILDETVNNYIAAAVPGALALLDLATGEFLAGEYDTEAKLAAALDRAAPAETIVPSDCSAGVPFAGRKTEVEPWTFGFDAAEDVLKRHFGTLSLDGFGLDGRKAAVSAAGALLHYVGSTLRHKLGHVRRIRFVQPGDALVLDSATLRHLNLVPSGDTPKSATLLGVLDATRTPMGARTLRSWILRPLATPEAINARLDAVGAYVRDRRLLADTRAALAPVRDLERLVQKVAAARATPRDLRALADSLRPLGAVRDANAAIPCAERISPEPETVALLDAAISREPPAVASDGGFIAKGYSEELDALREAAGEGRRFIAEYQTREQRRTGIQKLKVRHVPAFGFLIEIPKGQTSLVPPEYERRQTLVGAERYTTPELKEYERRTLGAQERAVSLELSLLRDLLEKLQAASARIQETASAIGELDAIMSLADRALAAGYTRPEIDGSDVLEIEDGRHPVVEQLPDAEPFVPNSTFLNCTTDQIMLITGPNMAGKSTYIRQVATIAVMAQAGSWVPASKMRMGVLDRVFTRIGAGDDLARGRSTFLVEMQETADILNNATGRSLVVLDEIGRGTSTFDGISIAWSVAEYLNGRREGRPKTLFATHYHELTGLADALKGVKNYTVKVKEEGGGIVFLRRIAPGTAEKSFGIHVGAMAGLPPEVVKRAGEILRHLESDAIDMPARAAGSAQSAAPAASAGAAMPRPKRKAASFPGQMTFFS
ncbi:MAG: DNA mismatch repair protein MutS [Kiritimatiellae bacterium]|nr:DNA mismatch repair protein MutS [Kiritimatiellia bacterium]